MSSNDATSRPASVAADSFDSADAPDQGEGRVKWKLIGPGIVVAGTGVGAADMVATLVAGQRYQYMLFWAVVLGTILKIVLVEGAGRYTLASGHSIFQGWRSLGPWTTWYFAPYIIIWGFVYGAAAMASTAMPLNALFPAIESQYFAIASGLLGLLMVWFGRYGFFEKAIAVMVGIMFVAMVGAAIMATPNIPAMLAGLVPRIPPGEDGVFTVLALSGGIGGTITLAAYGYWLREKGWSTPRWMRVMRIDNTMAYVMTGIFVISMLIVGAELLYSAQGGGVQLASGEAGLLGVADVLRERYGDYAGPVFLIGFASAALSSLVGVWHGVSLMFADFWGTTMAKEKEDSPRLGAKGRYFRFYVLWLTFPPMLLVWFFQEPVQLTLIYGVLGALFMPFLAVTLLFLLNTKRVPDEWRNKWYTNLALLVCCAVFIPLGIRQLWTSVQSFVSSLG